MVCVLHFVGDKDSPHNKIVDTLMAVLPPGSYLVVSHITPDEVSTDVSRYAQAVYADATARAHPRTREQITQFFDGLEITESGVVDVAAWRAMPRPGRTLMYGGVARKPRVLTMKPVILWRVRAAGNGVPITEYSVTLRR